MQQSEKRGLDGRGITARAMRAHDWSGHPLGPPERWPALLRQMVNFMLSSSESMYLLWGEDLHFFSNDAYRPILGPRIDRSIGTTLADLWPDAIGAVQPSIDTALRGESVRHIDTFVQMARRGEPEDTWWTFSFSPVYDDGGIARGVLCHTTETTRRVLSDRRRDLAESRLRAINDRLEAEVTSRTREQRESEARARAYFLASPEYLMLLSVDDDERMTFEDINPSVESLIGRSRVAALGRSPRELLPADGVDEVERRVLECLRTGLKQTYGARWSYSGRAEIFVEAVVALVERRGARGGLVLLIAHDRTEQRRAEDQLRQAQKMEAVGQLTGGVAHDFNNLLSTISFSLELIRRLAESGQVADMPRLVATADRSVKGAAALTQRLLAFSSKQSLDLRTVDVNQLARSLEDMLSRTLGEQISLELRLGEDAWPVHTDANQLENALLNLAINARDAMSRGGKLTIETDNLHVTPEMPGLNGLAPGDYVVVSVSDNGTGMPPSVIERAFDPFFTTKSSGQGTGLGLSMIYGYARQSGGHVSIFSLLGEGTTVKLFLPRALQEDMPASAEPGREIQHGVGERILVVDDNDDLRQALVEALEGCGYRVTAVSGGIQALEHVKTGSFELLVTDVGLPDLSGRQLAELARAARPKLPVLLITGYAKEAAVRGEFVGEGMDMLSKPFALYTLARKVQEMVRRQ